MNSRQDSPARGSLVGARVGRFEIVAEIGSGGMASVYLARAVGTAGFQRAVAVKVMHRHLASEDAFVEMFLDEARVAATIHHPNVVPIVDVGLDDGLIYLVMDYIEGDSFAAVERVAINVRRRIPLGIILRIALDALGGLHAAHELCGHDGKPLKIIHRDVSPQNIVVGVDGVSRIVDFGIAKAETRITQTKVGTLKGKLNFMAPEQLRGQALDRRVDVFAMGVTLWEAITLRRLYPGESEVEIARRILSGAYSPLVEYDPKLPPAIDEVCRKALAVTLDERYATAQDFAIAIEERLGSHVASTREVASFISGVASAKMEKERRAMREWLAQHGDRAEELPEEDEFDTGAATMVEMPKKALAAVMRRSDAPPGESSGTRRAVRSEPVTPPRSVSPAVPVVSSSSLRADSRPGVSKSAPAGSRSDQTPKIPPQAPLPVDLAMEPGPSDEATVFEPMERREPTQAISLVTPRTRSNSPAASDDTAPSPSPVPIAPTPSAHRPASAPVTTPQASVPAPVVSPALAPVAPSTSTAAGEATQGALSEARVSLPVGFRPPPRNHGGMLAYVLLAIAFASSASAVLWYVLHRR